MFRYIKQSLAALLISCSQVCADPAIPTGVPNIPLLLILGNGNTGSGFFLDNTNHLFLVTARHVLFHQEVTQTNTTNFVLNSPRMRVTYFHRTSTNDDNEFVECDLGALMNAGEIRFHTNRDIAVVRMETHFDTNNWKLTRFDTRHFQYPVGRRVMKSVTSTSQLKRFADVVYGNDTYHFGYPTSVTGPVANIIDPMRPLMRRGIVADKNPKTRDIVLDCPAYHGNSGGPVIEVDRGIDATGVYVIGITVKFVPAVEVWQNLTQGYQNQTVFNSGYSIVEPSDFILDLLW